MPRTRRLSTAVADILQAAFTASGHTQSHVADQAGISQSQLSKYLRGVRVPTIDVLDDLCRALELDVADVIRRART